MERIGAQLLAQALQGTGDVFFHRLGGDAAMPGDLCIAHAGDAVEQVHLAGTFGQLEQCLSQQGDHLPGFCLTQRIRRSAGGLFVAIAFGQRQVGAGLRRAATVGQAVAGDAVQQQAQRFHIVPAVADQPLHAVLRNVLGIVRADAAPAQESA